jgi:PKD repeat protein
VPTSWQWTFAGGTPGTSTSQNPTNIQYALAGVYQVKLIATNSYGTDTIVRTKYVHVSAMIGIGNNEITVNDYKLEQNYPNPFNPTTNIKYQIAKNDFVSLKVYDIMGREVATLVNGKMNAGNYKTTFNGEHLTSGVYYYQLSSGDFRETKKLLLIK